jgi:hypothetical protein
VRSFDLTGTGALRRVARNLIDILLPRSDAGYYPAAKTISAARRAGMSVPAYVERLSNAEGQTELVLERLASAGALESHDRICEIGAGAGRYLDRLLPRCTPSQYDVYELDSGWARYLAATYPAIRAQKTDGETLAPTPSNSCGLVTAFGVFIASRPLQTFSYIREMVRVAKPGGFIAFDFYPAGDATLQSIFDKWLPSEHRFAVWLPEPQIIELLGLGRCEVVHRSTLDFVWSQPVLLVARKRKASE